VFGRPNHYNNSIVSKILQMDFLDKKLIKDSSRKNAELHGDYDRQVQSIIRLK
jgi:hypothetical protein